MDNREEKFKLRQTSLTANEKALQEYRDSWTTGNHNFGRVYLGEEKKLKVYQLKSKLLAVNR